MAAITLTKTTRIQGSGNAYLVRTATAQANTGQVDWISPPDYAKFCRVSFNLTAAAGTTPVTDLTIKGLIGSTLDDTQATHFGGTTLTAQGTTATSLLMQVVDLGPTGTPVDLVLGATGTNQAVLPYLLPQYLGLGLVFDRGAANETYTYTLTVQYWR